MHPSIPTRTLAVTTIAALALAGCSTQDGSNDSSEDGEFSAGDVTLDSKPERIVSLSATTTEMLFAIGADDQVTAVDSTSNYPEKAPTTELDAFAPNVEAIAEYEPDLVVLSHDQEDVVKQLEDIELPTYFAPAAESLEDTYSQIEDLGALTGNDDTAAEVNDEVSSRLDDALQEAPDEDYTAYYELDDQYYSLTSDTYAGSLLEAANLENIADGAEDAEETGGYPQLSAEYVVDADPDVVFVAGGQAAAELQDRDGWDSVTAVTEDNIVELDGDLASRWGPRVADLVETIVDGVQQV